MRKILVLLFLLISVVTFGQGEILKAHYLWEYNEPSDWVNIRYCPNDEILISTTDSINQRIYLYCTVASSGKYIVEIYGGEKSDTLIKKQLLTSNTRFDYTIPTGKGKHYGSNGFTQYKIRIYPEIKTKKIILFNSADINSGYLLVNVGANLSNIYLSSKYSGKGVCLRYVQMQRCTNLVTLWGYPFAYCSNLQYITLPKTMNNLTSLGNDNIYGGTFASCTSLKRIIFPDSLPNLTSMFQCFWNCTSLQYVKMPLSMKKLASLESSFEYCASLKQIQLPLALPALTNMCQTFSNCSSLVYVRMPELSLLAGDLMGGIFARCISLVRVNLNGLQNMTSLAGWFPYCSSLTEIKLQRNMPLIESFGSHNTIGYALGTFNRCTNIRKITLPDSVPHLKFIYNEAFLLCTNLDTLIFFKKADSLTSFSYGGIVSIPSLDTITTCTFGNSMVDWSFIIKDLRTFIQPSLKVSKLLARGNSLATASQLHTINIDWANSTYGGTSPQIDIRWNSLSATTIDAIFTALPVVTGKTINVAGNPGSATCTPAIASLKGWTVIVL